MQKNAISFHLRVPRPQLSLAISPANALLQRRKREQEEPKVARYRPVDMAYRIKFAAAQMRPHPIPNPVMEKQAAGALLGIAARLAPKLLQRAGTWLGRGAVSGGVRKRLGWQMREAGLGILATKEVAAQRGLHAASRQATEQATQAEALRAAQGKVMRSSMVAGQAKPVPKLYLKPGAKAPPRAFGAPNTPQARMIEGPWQMTPASGAKVIPNTPGVFGAPKPGVGEAYKDVFREGGLGRLWNAPGVKSMAGLGALMQAPGVISGETDPLSAVGGMALSLPAMRAGMLPGIAASMLAPSAISRVLPGQQAPQQYAPIPQGPSGPPVNVNVMPSQPQMPMMPQMPSMLPGVR